MDGFEIFVYVPQLDQVLKAGRAEEDVYWAVKNLPQNIYFFGEYVMVPADV